MDKTTKPTMGDLVQGTYSYDVIPDGLEVFDAGNYMVVIKPKNIITDIASMNVYRNMIKSNTLSENCWKRFMNVLDDNIAYANRSPEEKALWLNIKEQIGKLQPSKSTNNKTMESMKT